MIWSFVEQNHFNMKNNNLIRFAFGLIVLPMTALPTGTLPQVNNPQSVLVQKMNTRVEALLALNQADDAKTKTLQLQADAIDAYFSNRNAPLAGTGMKMAIEADKNDLDWRLLPAIATRESNAGKEACRKVEHSFFGWGSCKIEFESDDQAIEIVALHLGGNHENTDQYYAGKTTYQILRKYNTVIKKYPEQVIKIMDAIGPEDVNAPDASATAKTEIQTKKANA